MPNSTTAGPYDLPRLREQIRALFSDGELRDLCMDLGIDYENLPGAAKGDKARELVLHAERMGQLADLVARVVALRPHIGLNIQRLTEGLASGASQQFIQAEVKRLEAERDWVAARSEFTAEHLATKVKQLQDAQARLPAIGNPAGGGSYTDAILPNGRSRHVRSMPHHISRFA